MKFLFCSRHLALGVCLFAGVWPSRCNELAQSLAKLSSSLEQLLYQLPAVPVMSAEDIVQALGEDKILAHDPTKRIWQLKALQQLSKECGWHQQRNVVYAGLICSSPKNQIAQLYADMVNKELYEAYATVVSKKYGCQRNRPEGFGGNIVKLLFDLPGIKIPREGIRLLPVEVQAAYYGGKTSGDQESEGALEQAAIEKARAMIQLVEKRSSDQDVLVAGAYTLLGGRIHEHCRRLAESSSGLLCLALGVFTVQQGHAVVLIVHKFEGVYSYFFVESLNSSFLTGGFRDGYQTAIDLVKKLVEDPGQKILQNAGLRSFASGFQGAIDKTKNIVVRPPSTEPLRRIGVWIDKVALAPQVLQGRGYTASSLWAIYKPYFVQCLEALSLEISGKLAEEHRKKLAKALEDLKAL